MKVLFTFTERSQEYSTAAHACHPTMWKTRVGRRMLWVWGRFGYKCKQPSGLVLTWDWPAASPPFWPHRTLPVPVWQFPERTHFSVSKTVTAKQARYTLWLFSPTCFQLANLAFINAVKSVATYPELWVVWHKSHKTSFYSSPQHGLILILTIRESFIHQTKALSKTSFFFQFRLKHTHKSLLSPCLQNCFAVESQTSNSYLNSGIHYSHLIAFKLITINVTTAHRTKFSGLSLNLI